MKSCIKDPLREVRIVLYVLAALVLVFSIVLVIIDSEEIWLLLVFASVYLPLLWVASATAAPYVELSPEGITYRYFFKKQEVSWDALVQVCFFLKIKLPGYSLILPGGVPYKKGQRYDLFDLRNPFRHIHLPNDPEIGEMIRTYYGEPDYDQLQDLNEWGKKYYKSVYDSRKEKEE